MYSTVVTICTVQWSLYVPHSGHYMYRTVVTICTVQWSLYVPYSGHYMYRTVVTICTASLTFSNSTFCPHSCIYVFCVDLRTNSDYFPIQHWLTGFYFQGRHLFLKMKALHPPKRQTLPTGRHTVSGLPLSPDTLTCGPQYIASGKTTAVELRMLSGRTESNWGNSRVQSLINSRVGLG
jgi:hypothetical protein